MNTTTPIVRTAKLAWRHLAGLVCLLAGTALQAQTTETWDNGSGNFLWDTTSLNWSGTAWADGNNASFGSTGAGTITVDGTRSLNNLTISAAGYVFTNGILNIADGSGTILWTLNNNATIASGVTANLIGAGKFENVGQQTLTLSGLVTLNGDAGSGSFFEAVNGGVLMLAGNANCTNIFLMATVGTSQGTVLITGGTDVFTGTTARRGLAVNGGTSLSVCGGNITSDRLVVANGSSGIYTQTNGTVTITGTIGGGVSQPVGVEIGAAATATQSAKLNLDGGRLIALGIVPDASWLGTSLINLNGGIFQCTADTANLFATDVTGSQAGGIYLGQSVGGGDLTNGAAIDTAGYSVIQTQPFVAGTPSGGLLKLGAGTLDLRGANTYTGATVVSNGTLLVDGSLVAGSAVATTAGGTIGGGGTINGPVTVDAGGTVSPGSGDFGLGTLTVNNDLTLAPGAGALFRLDTASPSVTNDSLVVNGAQNITDSTLTVVNTGPALAVGDRFTLLSQPTADFTTVNLPAGYTWANRLSTDGSIQVLASIIPQPIPTDISYAVAGNEIIMNWLPDQNWHLQAQTNNLDIGLSTNWFNVTGAAPPVLISIDPTNAAVFYRLEQGCSLFVSPNGSDTNSGTLGSPLRTLAAAMPLLNPGDTLYLRAGTYPEILTPVKSGNSTAPITVAAYSNEVVNITGCDQLSGAWTYVSNGIYATSVSWDLGEGYNQIFVDGVMQREAQYPNWTATNSLLTPPTVNVKVYNNYTITNTATTGFGALSNLDLTGAHFLGGVGQAWAWQTAMIASNDSQQVFLDPGTATTTWWWPNQAKASSQTGVGLVYGKLNLLDADGEWYYDSTTSTLYLRIAGGADPTTHTVEMKHRVWCVNFNGCNHVVVRGISTRAGAIQLNGVGNILDDCNAEYLSHYLTFPSGGSRDGGFAQGGGVVVSGVSNTVENCVIHDTAGCGINVTGGSQNLITHNHIYNTDYAGTYSCCISLAGTGQDVLFNTAHDSGRDIIIPGGSGHDIEYNDLSHSGRLCLDEGVIYTYGQNATNDAGTPTRIAYNWIHDGNTNDVHNCGIYLDNGSRNFLVDHNVVWNTGLNGTNHGIYLNAPAEGSQLYHNTLVNCGTYNSGTWDNFPANNPDPTYWTTNNNHLFYTGQNNLVLNSAVLVSSNLVDPASGDFQLQAASEAVNPTFTTNTISWWTTNSIDGVPAWFTLNEMDRSLFFSYQEAAGQGVVLPGINDGYLGSTPDSGAYEYGRPAWYPGTNGWSTQ